MKLVLSRQFFENFQIEDFMKNRSVGAKLLHAEGQTYRRTRWKPIVALSNSTKTLLKMTPLRRYETPRTETLYKVS